VSERGRRDPGLERLLVAPPGHDEPRRALVGRLEQFEALEPVLVVDGAGPCGEAAREFVAAVGGHGDGVDLDDGHTAILAGGTGAARPARNGAYDAEWSCPQSHRPAVSASSALGGRPVSRRHSRLRWAWSV